ncbi:MAG: hypothetical protein GXO34_00625 [Deltaproteobacteria bacterium]|nr:hypothetical protein [Deltaproteobacteria bacterium]
MKIFSISFHSLNDFWDCPKLDGFVKSPPASHPEGISSLRSGHSRKVFVTAAYFYVRRIPQLSGASHLELFTLPSRLLRKSGLLRVHQAWPSALKDRKKRKVTEKHRNTNTLSGQKLQKRKKTPDRPEKVDAKLLPSLFI